VTGSLALFGRLFAYTDRRPEITDAPDARDLTRVHGAVRLEHVTFTYPGATRPAVDDLTLDIEPGQLVALVGPSGAGKTTLTPLPARSHDPTAGRILVDGTDHAPVVDRPSGHGVPGRVPVPRLHRRQPAVRPPRRHRRRPRRRRHGGALARVHPRPAR